MIFYGQEVIIQFKEASLVLNNTSKIASIFKTVGVINLHKRSQTEYHVLKGNNLRSDMATSKTNHDITDVSHARIGILLW